MSTRATSVQEIEARMRAGVAGRREMEQLLALVDLLTWRQMGDEAGPTEKVCRHCGQPSTAGHMPWCTAEGIE